MDEIQITLNHDSELAKYLADGDYDEAVKVLSLYPETFSSLIKITSESIKQSKSSAEAIRDRGWWKKMWSSNSTDLAKIIIDQNGTISNFFVILKLLILQTKGNVKLMTNLCSTIQNFNNVEGKEQDNLSKLAILFLEQNIESIKDEELRDKALKKLLIAAEMTDQFEFRMASEVSEIEDSNKSFKEEINLQLFSFKEEIENKLADIDNKITNQAEAINAKISDLDGRYKSLYSSTKSELESEIIQLRDENSSLVSLIQEKEQKIAEQYSYIRKKQNRLTFISIIIGIGLLCAIVLGLFA